MEELFKVAAESGISVVLAAVVLIWARADAKAREDGLAQRLIEERQDKLELLKVLHDSTEAITMLTSAIAELRGDLRGDLERMARMLGGRDGRLDK